MVAFRVLPRKDAAAVFEYLPHDSQDTLLKSMGHEDVAALLNQMAPDDRTMFLEELPAAATRQLLSLLTPAQRSVAMTLLGYPEDSIGRLMTPSYVAVREDWTVRQVLDHIRAYGQDSETLDVIYVVDQQGLLVDDIRLRELLLTAPENHVHDLMDHRFIALKATDDQQTAVAAFRSYDRTALPVTDTAGMLIGIVTIDDVLDVAEATATKEIQRIGGSEALDEPYMDIAFWTMIRKRGSWLTALFLGELLTATAMGAFEAEISKAVVLAMFIPLIISSGGNSGSQASTLVIRALALGEVGLKDWWRVMRREILAGLALGDAARVDWLHAHFHLVDFFKYLWGALAAGRSHRRFRARRHRAVGNADRIAAAVHLATSWLRSRDVVRAVCRDARRRDRSGDLFQRRARDFARHVAVMPDGVFVALRVGRSYPAFRLPEGYGETRRSGPWGAKAVAELRRVTATPALQSNESMPLGIPVPGSRRDLVCAWSSPRHFYALRARARRHRRPSPLVSPRFRRQLAAPRAERWSPSRGRSSPAI